MRFDLNDDHKFIVIASDGVWEFLSNEEIGQIVWPFFLQNSPE
jgi:serine/threonine protein phosphatase PrpC